MKHWEIGGGRRKLRARKGERCESVILNSHAEDIERIRRLTKTNCDNIERGRIAPIGSKRSKSCPVCFWESDRLAWRYACDADRSNVAWGHAGLGVRELIANLGIDGQRSEDQTAQAREAGARCG